LMGKEAALFVPSGTMANLLAFLSQTRPGDTVILSEESHPFNYENANLAMIGGLLTRTAPDPFGKLNVQAIEERVVQVDDAHYSQTTLAAIENTTNRGGGACYTYDEVESVAAFCRNRGLRLHCDGARIFNAAATTNVDARFYAQQCDTLSFCLSKGLGAPAGSLLTGDRETIHRAHRFRKMLGGGMRQAGVLAAAGLYALEHHIEDLEEDHRRARSFRYALEGAGVAFALPSPTNILFVDGSAPDVHTRLAEKDLRVNPPANGRLRVVFHRDIDDEGLANAIEAFKQVLGTA
jgi:threonine aldolase